MPQTFKAKASHCRRIAAMCGNLADCAQSAADHKQLLRMRESWLALTANLEWLDGLPPLPPANVIAFAVTRH